MVLQFGDNQASVKLKIAKVLNTQVNKMFYQLEPQSEIYIVVNLETLKNTEYQISIGLDTPINEVNFGYKYTLLMNTANDKETMENKIEQIKAKYHMDDYGLTLYYSDNASEENTKIITQTFLYSINVLIIFVMISNIVNVLSSDMIVKNKEFAVLSSIGMEKKQYKKMLLLEYISYLGIGFIFGMLPAVFVNYIIYLLDKSYYMFKFPYMTIGATIIALMSLLIAIMVYINKKMKKNNIMEIIKNENI